MSPCMGLKQRCKIDFSMTMKNLAQKNHNWAVCY